jgi:hypothetical protein
MARPQCNTHPFCCVFHFGDVALVPIIPQRISAHILGVVLLLGLGSFLFPSLAPLPGVFPLFIYSFIYLFSRIDFRQNCKNRRKSARKKLSFGSVIKFGKNLQRNLQWNIPQIF